jgi:hypothetical protein
MLAQSLVQLSVVIIQVDAQLVRVRPVKLPIGRQVMRRLNFESALSIRVREI